MHVARFETNSIRPSTLSASVVATTQARKCDERHVEAKPDAWSALIAACMSPDDYVVIERDGELFIEPARKSA